MPSQAWLRLGTYELHGVLGTGGMATVHFGRAIGALGFSRGVAIKRLLPHIRADHGLVRRFFDEARLAARIRHTNVVQTLDVVLDGDEGLVVMEYVLGETLGRLLQVACKSDEPPPSSVVSAILSGSLHGLHAAHNAKSELDEPLGIVHRDVSPQNVLVGADGIARILDFGIAKATAQASVTPGGQLKGKAAYMAPELLLGGLVTYKADLFAAGVVLWESLVGRRLFLDETEAKTLSNVLSMPIEPPSAFVPGLSEELDRVVVRSLERDPAKRFDSARAMALALERAAPPASVAEVAAWVEWLAHDALAARRALLSEVEGEEIDARPRASRSAPPPPARWRFGSLALGGALAAVVLATSFAVALRSPKSIDAAPAAVASGEEPPPSPVVPQAIAETPAPVLPSALPPGRGDRVLRTRAQTPKSVQPNACTPPFLYNAQGHMVFKPQCF